MAVKARLRQPSLYVVSIVFSFVFLAAPEFRIGLMIRLMRSEYYGLGLLAGVFAVVALLILYNGYGCGCGSAVGWITASCVWDEIWGYLLFGALGFVIGAWLEVRVRAEMKLEEALGMRAPFGVLWHTLGCAVELAGALAVPTFLVFLALKLFEVVEWPWLWVLSPLWIIVLAGLGMLAFGVISNALVLLLAWLCKRVGGDDIANGSKSAHNGG